MERVSEPSGEASQGAAFTEDLQKRIAQRARELYESRRRVVGMLEKTGYKLKLKL